MGVRELCLDEYEAPREVRLLGFSKPDVKAGVFSPHHTQRQNELLPQVFYFLIVVSLLLC